MSVDRLSLNTIPGPSAAYRAKGSDRPAGAAPAPEAGNFAAPAHEAVRRAAELINHSLQESRRELMFSVDQATGRTIVRVVSSLTGEVLRQIPAEELLALASRLEAGEALNSLGLDRWS